MGTIAQLFCAADARTICFSAKLQISAIRFDVWQMPLGIATSEALAPFAAKSNLRTSSRPKMVLVVLPMLPVPNQPAPNHTVLRLILGPLETRVMEVLWECNECCVRQVLPRLHQQFAYTTIMSTLDRLYKKKFANRRKCGRAYVYSARVSCQEWKDIVARDVAAKLLAGSHSSREVLIACLLEAVRLQEPDLLEDIETTLKDKRGGLVKDYNGA